MMLNTMFLKLNRSTIVLALASMCFYGVFAYGLVRTDYLRLITLYTALFFLFYKLVQKHKNNIRF